IHDDSCGSKGIGETPQGVSPRRLTSRPRKAACISGAVEDAPTYTLSYVAVYGFCFKNDNLLKHSQYKNARPSALQQRDERSARGSTLISAINAASFIFNADDTLLLTPIVQQQSLKVVIIYRDSGSFQPATSFSCLSNKTNDHVLIITFPFINLFRLNRLLASNGQ
ncbi:MAG TPA: hypothetical protein VK097_11275, partial [Lentibacillus sp.]|nr:hypothetical protein [Lentibacillus sp.]